MALDRSEEAAAVARAAWPVYRARTRDRGSLSETDFVALFGQELAHVREDPGSAAAALRATAQCLSRRGIGLADALTAGTVVSEHAALPSPERARVYAEVYLAEDGRSRRCNQALPAHTPHAPQGGDLGIVGSSAAIARVRERIVAAARGQSALVTGETGTGKELVARAVHVASDSRGRFVPVNCAALPRHLVESELFGHVRGAFTGAQDEAPGLFRAADGGTLFLDEVTEMGMDVQAKLLRALEERVVRPVGSTREHALRVRVVASTNRDPKRAIAEARLREDLYYRLQSFTIQVPPLRERREDIPLLVEHFLGTFCSRRCGCVWGFSEEAMAVLAASDWPGNVRELRNVVEHAVTTGDTGLMGLRDLPPSLAGTAPADAGDVPVVPTLAEAEAQAIRLALARFAGNRLRAARALGISRHKLYDRIRSLALE